MVMNISSALRVAISLYLLPAQSPKIKKASLPHDIEVLLLIAAGNEEELTKAADITDRSKETTKKAAIFFIENILLAHDANSYRILGVNSNATNDEIRRNMALMTRYLHPDINKNDTSVFMTRVTNAWSDLKTAEKRAIYDSHINKIPPRVKTPSRKHNSRMKSHGTTVPKKKNSSIAQQPLSKRRQLRGVFFRQITLLLAKLTGRS